MSGKTSDDQGAPIMTTPNAFLHQVVMMLKASYYETNTRQSIKAPWLPQQTRVRSLFTEAGNKNKSAPGGTERKKSKS